LSRVFDLMVAFICSAVDGNPALRKYGYVS
jgi:hypothetical protein